MCVRKSLYKLAAILLLLGCALPASAGAAATSDSSTVSDPIPEDWSKAIFAGGCFWCMEQALDEVSGVKRTISGYTGGHVPDPTYHQVSGGGTGHREAVLVYYDPDIASYQDLLHDYWLNVDPTDAGGQFCDRGHSYTTAIWFFTKKQKQLATASKQQLANKPGAPGPIVTPILEAEPFYRAEDYHQNYYQKYPFRYHTYKFLCGRQGRLEELWGAAAGGSG